MSNTEKTFVGKLTVATIRVKPARFVDPGKAVPIAHFFGKANAIKTVADKLTGDVYEALQGQFEAVNLETGEVFNSGVLYLPSGIHDIIMSQVRGLKEETESVGFALELCVVQSGNKAGYSYEARDVMPAKVDDDLAAYRKVIAARRPLTLNGTTGEVVNAAPEAPAEPAATPTPAVHSAKSKK